MTRIWDEQFEGTGYEETWSGGETVGGSSVLDEDFATASVAGAPADWDAQCLRVLKASGENAFVEHDLASPQTTLYARCEVIFKSFPSALSQFANIAFLRAHAADGTTIAFEFRIQERGATNNGPYQLQFTERSTGSLVSHNSANIALDTRYRLEGKYDIAGNAWEWRLGGVTQDSGTFTGGPSEVQDNIRIGAIPTGGGAAEFFLDNVALDDADWIGAEAAGGGGGAGARLLGGPKLQRMRLVA